MKIMTNTNKMIHCKFILSIFYTFIAIAKKLIFQEIFIVLQKDIFGEDVIG